MKYLALLCLVSCAELRSGWVKVDFMDQEPCRFCVCEMKISDESTARCVDMEEVEREMIKKRASEQGDL